MQGDGNLVVIAPGNVAVWSTRTNGNTNATLELQNDGNVVVYAQGHLARWGSGVPMGSSALADRVVATARAEAANSAHNHETAGNCNFYTYDLFHTYGLNIGTACDNGWRAEEWCADFARWIYQRAGAQTAGLSAGAASFYRYDLGRHTWRQTGPRIGDAVVFNLDPTGKTASHVGIIVGVNSNGTITTVEGNEHDRVSVETFTPSSRGVSGYSSPVSR
jgi:uncharacterized protein (TIGR02594 family)